MAFKASRDTAYNSSWDVTVEQSPDKDLDSRELKTLRERSQQLIRDNLVVSGMQQVYINQILSYGPTIYSGSTNRIQRSQINKYLESRLSNCDSTGTKSLIKLLEEIVSSAFADGDIGVNLPMIDGETCVELIEAQRIDTPINFRTDAQKYLYRHGIKYKENGRIEGMYVKKAEFIDTYKFDKDSFTFLPFWKESNGYKRRVTTLFKAPLNSRPLASRQYPLITPMIPYLKNMDDYAEAVIVGARVAACFAAFIQTSNPNAAQKSMAASDTNTSLPAYTKLQPGTIMYLRPNEIASFASPNKPSDNHDAFVLRSYKTIAMAFRIPYILAFLDTEQVSYSSWRGAVLDSFKLIQRWRRDLTEIILWVVNTFILEGIASEEIRGNLDTANIKVRWPSIGMLDPEKEARAAKIDIDNKVKSRQMICDERGSDYEDVLREREEEELLEVELQAKVLKAKKDKEESLGIIFPDTVQPDTVDVNGESEQPDPEGAKEKRKTDGNW